MKKLGVVDGDVWKKAAQRLARAIIRFQNNDQRVHSESTVLFAVAAFFGVKRASKRDETPEQMLKRGFEQSYPGWIADGLLKKPDDGHL